MILRDPRLDGCPINHISVYHEKWCCLKLMFFSGVFNFSKKLTLIKSLLFWSDWKHEVKNVIFKNHFTLTY